MAISNVLDLVILCVCIMNPTTSELKKKLATKFCLSSFAIRVGSHLGQAECQAGVLLVSRRQFHVEPATLRH